MIDDPGHVHHAIDYIEFSVTDMAATRAFLAAAFGWSFRDYGPGYAGIVRPDGSEAGGLCLVEAVQSGGPLVVLYSRDLDASLAAVIVAGGQIVAQPFHFPGGRRFELREPSGNHLAVWSPR